MEQKVRKSFGFSDNCIWIGSNKFSQSWTGYFAWAVIVLTNTSKISPKTRGYISGVNFPENDDGDFTSIWDAFTCWMAMRVLKRLYLESFLTKIFTVYYFGNTLAMTIILFSKS